MSEQVKNCKSLGQNHSWSNAYQEGISRVKVCQKCGDKKNLITSRADRLGGCIAVLQGIADNLQEAMDNLEEYESELDNSEVEIPEEEKETKLEERKQDLADNIDAPYFDDVRSEIQSLSEEMRSWADNMEGAGTGLENTEKYERVSEAADILEEQGSEFEDIDVTGIEWDSIEEIKDNLENIIGELEGVEFPGMFG
jgi:chromosome segregation ATPase